MINMSTGKIIPTYINQPKSSLAEPDDQVLFYSGPTGIIHCGFFMSVSRSYNNNFQPQIPGNKKVKHVPKHLPCITVHHYCLFTCDIN